MRKIVFDIETKNFFGDTGSNDPASLDLSLVCTYDYETDRYDSFFEQDLGHLWPVLEQADLIIGFNSDHFDIPLLNKYYAGDLSKIKSLDILKEIKKACGRRVSLNQISHATLGKKKLGHGSDAMTWWKNGDLESLKKYCLEDVKITKEVYDYARTHHLLKYSENGLTREIPLATGKWEEKATQGLTFTLPF